MPVKFKLYKDGDDLLILDYLATPDSSVEHVEYVNKIEQGLEEIYKNNPGKKFRMFVDDTKMSNPPFFPPEVIKKYVKLSKDLDKIAVWGHDKIIQGIVDVVIKVSGKSDKFKWFNDKEKALKWLNS